MEGRFHSDRTFGRYRDYCDPCRVAVAGAEPGQIEGTNAACLNNQKQLLLGFIMYADDNGDKMIYTVGAPGQPANIGGGYWPGPYNDSGKPQDFTANMKSSDAQRWVENGLRKGALFRFVNAPAPIIAPVTCAQNDFCLEKAMLTTVIRRWRV